MAKGLTLVVRAITETPSQLLRKKLKLQSCYFYSNCYAKNTSVNKKKKKKTSSFQVPPLSYQYFWKVPQLDSKITVCQQFYKRVRTMTS